MCTVFGFLVVATSSHNYFSLVAGGALVEEPRHRPAAFGIRAASLQLGWLIGNVGAAIASSGGRGFRPVMLMSAVACGCAAIAALVVGTVERPKFQGCDRPYISSSLDLRDTNVPPFLTFG